MHGNSVGFPLAAVAGMLLLAPSTWAQSVSGTASVMALCGGTDSRDIHLGDDFTLSRHGECPAPHDPGQIASINDATAHVLADHARLFGNFLSQTDFRGTSDGSGTATSNAIGFRLDANDLVFTDAANPNRTDPIAFSLNFEFAAIVDTVGASNCNTSQPFANLSLFVFAGASSMAGSYNVTAGNAVVAGGPLFEGYPNDGSVASRVAREDQAPLGSPIPFRFDLTITTSVLECDHPPATVSSARASIDVHLPCGTPVFNLPPGITANSAQLNIVNNIWMGPVCCPADFNHDGMLNSQDFFDFLAAFFAGAPAADFNADNSVNSQDFFDFLTAFFIGC